MEHHTGAQQANWPRREHVVGLQGQVAAGSAAGSAPVPAPPVAEAVMRLRDATELLGGFVERLYVKLAPVIPGIESVAKGSPGAPPPGQSPLVCQLCGIADALHAHLERADAALRAAEL